jgi:23S rRNA (cytosine1962-C5)-methyltransferase
LQRRRGFRSTPRRGRRRRSPAIDLDEKALARAKKNARLNDARINFAHADLFPFLREARDAKHRFDVVVLDPHELATGKGEVQQGLAKYRDMNQLAFNVVAPGGLLLAFSGSGAATRDAFEGVVAAAAEALGTRSPCPGKRWKRRPTIRFRSTSPKAAT